MSLLLLMSGWYVGNYDGIARALGRSVTSVTSSAALLLCVAVLSSLDTSVRTKLRAGLTCWLKLKLAIDTTKRHWTQVLLALQLCRFCACDNDRRELSP